ncbi:Gaa1-like protein [Dipodascopsis tothii]|uniref:Gaa1-like protein n=1 Tax=Dipodascopsis tothii TaxID=44089 RepID=UPI0034CD5BD0
MTLVGRLGRRVFPLSDDIWTHLARKLPMLSAVMMVLGIAWLLVLPIEGQSRRTYVSENALLSGQALTHFSGSEINVVSGVREEVRLLRNVSDSVRTDTIRTWLTDMQYKAGVQPWEHTDRGRRRAGANVYGVLHAPRGDGTEAMVIAAPWNNAAGQFNELGVAVALSLARYFTRWTIWSKDIIVVIPSDPWMGLASWVSAYHTEDSLPVTSGAIQGAVVLDFPQPHGRFDSIEIQYEGINGALPNLDLINSAATICDQTGINIMIHGIEPAQVSNSYQSRRASLIAGILRQARAGLSDLGTGSQAFSGWRIDAITLSAHVDSNNADGHQPHDEMVYGRVVEAVVRSFNNLLEHFHQSFFFYLLLDPHRFVSIGTYLPAAMLCAASYTVNGIGHWIHASLLTTQSGLETVTALAAFGVIVTASWASMFAFAMLPASTTLEAFGTALLLCASVPYTLPKLVGAQPASFLHRFQAVALIYLGLFLTTLATLNFPLAMVLSVVLYPTQQHIGPRAAAAASAPPWREAVRRLNTAVALTCSCPPFLALAAALLTTPLRTADVRALLGKRLVPLFEDLVCGFRAVGVWTFVPVAFCVLVPVWTAACVVASTPVLPAAAKAASKPDGHGRGRSELRRSHSKRRSSHSV